MAVKIYWGPPGSYKTASAVWEEIARCVREGRHLITNIRGMDAGLLREHCPDVHPKFTMEHLRNDEPADLDRLRRWWHWAPPGAYVVLDEVQLVYPPDWTSKQLHSLDAPEPREINGNRIPTTLALAFDMHRHGNWDLAFTTPNIRKVIPEIRMAAECAYKHKNLAVVGLNGRFLHSHHMAEDNGNPSDIYSKRIRRIPAWVFKCYQSTATGQVRDSRAGLSMLANPRLWVVFAFLAVAGVLLFNNPTPEVVRKAVHAGGKVDPRIGVAPAATSGDVDGSFIPPGSVRAVSSLVKTSAATFRVIGTFRGGRQSYAILTDGTTTRRVDLSQCYESNLDGWRCGPDVQPSAWGSYDIREPDESGASPVDVLLKSKPST